MSKKITSPSSSIPKLPSIRGSRESLIRKTRDLTPEYVGAFSYVDFLDNDVAPGSPLRLSSAWGYLTIDALKLPYSAGLNIQEGMLSAFNFLALPDYGGEIRFYNRNYPQEGEFLKPTRLGASNYKLEMMKSGSLIEIEDVGGSQGKVDTHAALTASHGVTTIDGITERDTAISSHAALTASHGVTKIADDTGKGARVFNNANISIPNGVWTTLTFNSETYDQDTCHDPSTNPSRLTAHTAGKYMITGHVYFDLDLGLSGGRDIAIRLNGTTNIAIISLNASYYTGYSISTIMDLAVNDYVELRAYQNSGAALNILYYDSWTPYFAMQRISA